MVLHNDEPLTLPLAEFDAAWKYLDNMYNLNNVRRVKDGPIVNRYYLCRLFRKESSTSIIPQKRKRNKPARVPVGCPCRLKAVADESTMTITITRTTDTHNHDYDELGEKLNSGAKELLKREVVKGYSTPYLFKAMKDEKSGAWQLMKAAGGGGLSPKDVMNPVQTYRREHPDARGEVDIRVKDFGDSPPGEVLVCVGDSDKGGPWNCFFSHGWPVGSTPEGLSCVDRDRGSYEQA